MNKDDFILLYNKAVEAGMAAVDKATIEPMMVSGYPEPVLDGVCGFAWVVIKPATSAFARWLKGTGKARTNYGGGLAVWVSAFNQSMQKKEAYAGAFARVLRAAGIGAYAQSRMD